MNKYTTILVSAKSYEDEDDCLAAAAAEYATSHNLEAWEVEADWASDERDEIALKVPVASATVEDGDEDEDEDLVTIEEMPEHLRESHRAAGNWGRYPLNGAKRRQVTREEAEEIVAADADGYDHIVD
jgi:hypothetical protein